MATNEDREDGSKPRGTPPLMPRPGPTEVSSYQLMQLTPTLNISCPGGEFVWHAWMKCLDCRVMQLSRSGGLVYRKKQPLNHKQTVIIASHFISLDPSLAAAIHWPAPFQPPPPAPLPITVCDPRKYPGPITSSQRFEAEGGPFTCAHVKLCINTSNVLISLTRVLLVIDGEQVAEYPVRKTWVRTKDK